MQMGLMGPGVCEVQHDATERLGEIIANNPVSLLNFLVVEVVFLGHMPFGTEHEVGARCGDDIVWESIFHEFPLLVSHVFFQAQKTWGIRGHGTLVFIIFGLCMWRSQIHWVYCSHYIAGGCLATDFDLN